jgi:predicted DNA-binding protein
METVSSKEPRISVRVAAELKSRIEAITAKTGLDEASLVRNCIEALCDHVEKTGQISFPLEVGPKLLGGFPRQQPTGMEMNDDTRTTTLTPTSSKSYRNK